LDATQKETWQNAWDAVAGPNAVVCDNTFSKDYAQRKGFSAHAVESNWAKALGSAGVKTAMDVLSIDEQRGRTRMDATSDAIKAVDWAWDLFKLVDLVGERKKPKVFCFQEIMKADTLKQGYQNDEGVHIHVDIANEGQNNELKKTALEEVAHWITGATDCSRDFQNILIDALVTLA